MTRSTEPEGKNTICPAAKRFPVIFHKGRGTHALFRMQKKKQEETLLIFLYGQILPDLSAGNAMQNTTVD